MQFVGGTGQRLKTEAPDPGRAHCDHRLSREIGDPGAKCRTGRNGSADAKSSIALWGGRTDGPHRVVGGFGSSLRKTLEGFGADPAASSGTSRAPALGRADPLQGAGDERGNDRPISTCASQCDAPAHGKVTRNSRKQVRDGTNAPAESLCEPR